MEQNRRKQGRKGEQKEERINVRKERSEGGRKGTKRKGRMNGGK